jgi:hypothetical protein
MYEKGYTQPPLAGKVNNALAEIEEVTSVLTPADGFSVWQALADANLQGFEKIEIPKDAKCAYITWYKKVNNG